MYRTIIASHGWHVARLLPRCSIFHGPVLPKTFTPLKYYSHSRPLFFFHSLYKRAIGSDIIEWRRLRVQLSQKKIKNKKKIWTTLCDRNTSRVGKARTCSLFFFSLDSLARLNKIPSFDEVRCWHLSRIWYFLYLYNKNITENF